MKIDYINHLDNIITKKSNSNFSMITFITKEKTY